MKTALVNHVHKIPDMEYRQKRIQKKKKKKIHIYISYYLIFQLTRSFCELVEIILLLRALVM